VPHESSVVVELPTGAVGLPIVGDLAESPWATVVLAHGAGAGSGHPFLSGFARALADAGVSCVRFDFAYLAAGRRMPGPAAHAIAAWQAVYTAVASDAGTPVFAAGKSYGGRMASMAAGEGLIDPAGLVYLGYPLHPPGRSEKPRVEHLPAVPQPQLFLSGTNDPFVDPHDQLEDAVASCRDAVLAWVDGAGHSFEVKGARRPPADVAAGLVPEVARWMRDVLAR
jgi:uncharacterized protein